MNAADLVLIIILGGFVLSGLWWGIIHMVGSIIGYALGAYAAGRFYEPAAIWAQGAFGGNLNGWRIAAFLILFVIVLRLVGILVSAVDAAFKVISVIPFLKTFNRLLGAAFGFVEGVLVLSLAVYFAGRYPVSQVFGDALAGSTLAPKLNAAGTVFAWLLPLAVRLLKSVFARM